MSERLPIESFTQDLYDEAVERIISSSVGIIGVGIINGSELAHQSGSGTLIDLDGTHCIVTAAHVIDDICRRDRVRLLLDWNGDLHRCILDRNHLKFVRFARGATPDAGPDLGAIILPRNGDAIAALKSRKIFYNLRKRINRFSTGYSATDEGVWIPCGVIAEGSKELAPTRAFRRVVAHWAMCGVGSSPHETADGGFDYLELRGAAVSDPETPNSFGGVSGGGLWQARIGKAPNGSLKLVEVVLSGVIFYQTDVKNGRRGLRCHGRASLHKRLAKEIQRSI